MKYNHFIFIAFLLVFSSFSSNSKLENHFTNNEIVCKQGKAYWYVTHILLGEKKMYISKVFNNNCDYCYNEIRDSFKKFLIMNDYETNVNTNNMSTLHDVDEKELEERRNNEIYNRKQKGFQVISVNFEYKDK
jgi:hypothetical protein